MHKFKTIITICALFILANLQGCVWQTLSSDDIARGEKICAKRNAMVVEMSATFVGTEQVACSDNTTWNIWGQRGQELLDKE